MADAVPGYRPSSPLIYTRDVTALSIMQPEAILFRADILAGMYISRRLCLSMLLPPSVMLGDAYNSAKHHVTLRNNGDITLRAAIVTFVFDLA